MGRKIQGMNEKVIFLENYEYLYKEEYIYIYIIYDK